MAAASPRVAIRAVADLDQADWDEVFAFGSRYFEGAFVASIRAKRELILLREGDGRLVGIGAVEMFDLTHAGRTVTVIHVGNVAFADETRGQGYVQRIGFRYFLNAKARHPVRPMYLAYTTFSWRSYLMLARYFARSWPRRNAPLPAWERGLYERLGARLLGERFDPAAGVARNLDRRLRSDIVAVPERLAGDPDATYFADRNPKVPGPAVLTAPLVRPPARNGAANSTVHIYYSRMILLRIAGVAAAVVATLPLTTPALAGPAAGTGTITGVVTNPDGSPSSSTVVVHSLDDAYSKTAYTGKDGHYVVDAVPAGAYQIALEDNHHTPQWIAGALDPSGAETFTVTDGATVVADDRWLYGGTVRVTLSDSLTGKPVPRPCVTIRAVPNGVQACGRDGLVVLEDVPPGEWNILFSGGASYFPPPDRPTVSVQRGQTSRVAGTLEPGAAIRTKAVDAATGAALPYICAGLIATSWSGQNSSLGPCSDADGTIEIGPFDHSGTFHLFAQQYIGHSNPAPPVYYGAQWVGVRGGTGDQRKARTVTLTEHVTTTIPAIRMDRAGTITGTITSAATGQPVGDVCAFPYATYPSRMGSNANCSDSQGHYTIDSLGPYAWPVEFAPSLNKGLAWQWSGGAADRFHATYTTVHVGQTATVDAALVPGGTLTGTVTEGGAPASNVQVDTFNRKTHDYAGPTYAYVDSAGGFTLPGIRTQELWVRSNAFTKGTECWTPATVTDGQTTHIAIDLGADCGAKPAG